MDNKDIQLTHLDLKIWLRLPHKQWFILDLSNLVIYEFSVFRIYKPNIRIKPPIANKDDTKRFAISNKCDT